MSKKLLYARHNIKYENTFNQFDNCANFAGLTYSNLYIFPIDVYYSIAYNNKNLETNYFYIIGNWLNMHTIRYCVCRCIDEPIFLWWSSKVSKPCQSAKNGDKECCFYMISVIVLMDAGICIHFWGNIRNLITFRTGTSRGSGGKIRLLFLILYLY